MQRRSLSSVRIFYPKYDRTYILKILSERLKILDAQLEIIRAVLFGSYATGRYTVASDIDLLIVYKGKTRPDVYPLVKRRLDIPRLEPHLYSEVDYKDMEETINKMIEGGIKLLIEDRKSNATGPSPF
jgi:predicted nucleotidyltransferase